LLDAKRSFNVQLLKRFAIWQTALKSSIVSEAKRFDFASYKISH